MTGLFSVQQSFVFLFLMIGYCVKCFQQYIYQQFIIKLYTRRLFVDSEDVVAPVSRSKIALCLLAGSLLCVFRVPFAMFPVGGASKANFTPVVCF
jgi:hypothetical protein